MYHHAEHNYRPKQAINLLKLSGSICATCFMILKLYILPTECIFMFLIVHAINKIFPEVRTEYLYII
jgi:hypothetical protein